VNFSGSKAFIAKVKIILGVKAKGRHVLKGAEGYHLREEVVPYNAFFRAEKDDMGPKNNYFWHMFNNQRLDAARPQQTVERRYRK